MLRIDAIQPLQGQGQTTSELAVQGSLEGWELALILLILVGGLVAIAWPFIRSLARRLERPALEPDVEARLDRIEGSIHRLQALEERIAELEERLEFAERFLPRPGEPQPRSLGAPSSPGADAAGDRG